MAPFSIQLFSMMQTSNDNIGMLKWRQTPNEWLMSYDDGYQ